MSRCDDELKMQRQAYRTSKETVTASRSQRDPQVA
jgi:hypothetical protein